MKLSLKWLNEFFPAATKGIDAFVPEIKRRLPLSGIEIGAIKNMGDGISQVVVAQIVEFTKHPSADRLNVCKVDAGTGQLLQIVCGAPNVKAKMKVALAPVGCTLPGDFKIKQAQIRGVDSSGMLCSEKELGLSEESNGILELSESAPVGSSFVKALGLNDEIWEAELTPDRADCLSHWGIAREIARFVGHKPQLFEMDPVNPKDSGEVAMISVEIQAPKACAIYGAQVFDGISNGPSPEWMRRRLESLGTRSHDTVVDISNYILMELGHPVHMFDADKVKGSKIIVRFAKANEKIKTLDGLEHTLTPQDLVIADLEGPIALAGVMGGLESAVTASTTRVILECAVFDAEVVRAMGQRHKIHSESSHRFERGVDAMGRLNVVGRISLLLRTLAKARRRGAYIEVHGDKYEKAISTQSINFDLRAFKDVCGVEIAAEEIVKAFVSVGIEAQVKSPNVLKVEVPTHRHDLGREIDLIEEAARLIGYERIPTRYPQQSVYTQSSTRSLYQRLRQVRHRILDCGLSEMMPYNFISDEQAKRMKDVKLVEIKNPLSRDWAFMRPNLSFGFISVLSRHAALGQLSCGVFDQGSVFAQAEGFEKMPADDGTVATKISGVREAYHVGFALMGPRQGLHWSSDKKSADSRAEVDFFDGKGVAEKLIDGLTSFEARWSSTQFVALQEFLDAKGPTGDGLTELKRQAPWIPVDLLHPYKSALLVWPGKPPGTVVGYVGELHPAVKPDLLNLPKGLQLGTVVGELCVIADILSEMDKSRVHQLSTMSPRGKISLSKRLPIVERDLALVVGPTVKAAELERTMRKAVGAELLDITCIDLFKLADSKVSLAFRAQLQGVDKTLTDDEISLSIKKMLQAAKDKHQAELRG